MSSTEKYPKDGILSVKMSAEQMARYDESCRSYGVTMEQDVLRYIQNKISQTNDWFAFEQLVDLVYGYIRTKSIFVAAELGVPDIISKEPKGVDEIAERVHADKSALYRLLRYLASEGIFFEVEPLQFVETPLSKELRSDAKGGMHWLTLIRGSEFYKCWTEALYSFQTGEPVFERVFGLTFFEYLAKYPRRSEVFNRAMSDKSTHELAALFCFDWTEASRVADIGGGNGTDIAEVLKSFPHLRGFLVDLPTVAEAADEVLQKFGVRDRCEIIPGDFFKDSLPSVDTMILSQILHDWNDDRAREILTNCHHALAENGHLLLVEGVIPDDSMPSKLKLMDLHMLVLLGGKERTEREWRALLGQSGFRLEKIYPAGLIVAKPVQK